MTDQSTPIISHFTALVKVKNFQDEIKNLEEVANALVKELKLKIVKQDSYLFQPIGKTLVYILSESHLAIHTWPEYQVLHFDLVSCKEIKKEDFERALKKSLLFLKTDGCFFQTGQSFFSPHQLIH